MDLTLIIFAALALFLSYRLFNVLGTRGGHEPDEQDRPVLRPVPSNDDDEAMDAPVAQQVPETPLADLPGWAKTAREAIDDFEPKAFLDGAAAAYEMIVEAYASGDLGEVRGFVAPEVLESFEGGVAARREQSQTFAFTFVGVEKPDVTSMVEENGQLRANVRFRSEQVRAVRDQDGEVIEGDPEQVITVVDHWSFSRPVKSRDPNWTLVATGADEG